MYLPEVVLTWLDVTTHNPQPTSYQYPPLLYLIQGYRTLPEEVLDVGHVSLAGIGSRFGININVPVKTLLQSHAPIFAVHPMDEQSFNVPSKACLRTSLTIIPQQPEIAGKNVCVGSETNWTKQTSCIPEEVPVFGREQEVDLLLNAYSRSKDDSNCGGRMKQQELVLVHGNAGIGKTAFVDTLRAKMQRDGAGLFLSGKFEIGKCHEPYAVFVSALTQLVDELMDKSGSSQMEQNRLIEIRHVVGRATGREGQVLTNMIPALRQVIGSNGEKLEASGTDALHQFQLSLCKFCRSVAAVVPLVFFFDDLQWADKASLELLQTLLNSQSSHEESSSLLIVGSYRDEDILDRDQEDFSPHASTSTLLQKPPFYFSLRDWMHQSTSLSIPMRITNIQLCNLNMDATNALVATTLKLPPKSTAPLSQVVHAESDGNPFHSVQYLLSLSEKGKISGQWECEEMRTAKDLQVGSLQDMVCRKMENLTKLTQTVLQVAALLGDEVDEPALILVIDGLSLPEIEKALESASNEGLVVYLPERGRSRFAHDNIRQAALSMINDKDALSFEVGYKLWERLPPLYLDSKIFTVVGLMRGGVQTITNRAQRYKLATLHLEAGLKAYSRVAFPDASLYLESGIEFLRGGEHWSDEYQLTLDLLNAAVDAALCNQDFTRVAALVQEIQERGHSLKDKLPAYLAQINALGQHESVHEATRVGMDVLQQLGEFLPRRTSTVALIGEIIKTKVALRKRTNESILTLPPMEKENKIAAMNIMSILLPYAFQASSRQAVVIGARLSRFCLRHGMHTGFALGLATFAMVLCRSQKKEGYRLGRLALDLVGQNNSTQIIPRMYFYFYGLVHHWSRPLRKSLDPLSHAVQVGGEIGDIEYAMIALRFKCLHAFHCGEPLHVVERRSMTVEAAQQMRCFKQDNILRLTTPMIQLVQKLRNDNPISENCVSFRDGDEAECSNKTSVLFTKYNLDIEISYLLGDYDNVETIAALKRQLKMEGQALYSFAVAQWKEALSAVAQAHLGIRKWRNVKLARQVLKQMKRWAVDAPENFWHKTLLLEAELKSLISDDSAESRMKAQYVKAIRGALREHFTHEAAVACELLGDYMKRKGKRLQAEKYWNRALQLYLTWGARVKASQLVQRIEQHAQHSTAIDSA